MLNHIKLALPLLFFFIFQDRVLLYSTVWTKISSPLASVSQAVGTTGKFYYTQRVSYFYRPKPGLIF